MMDDSSEAGSESKSQQDLREQEEEDKLLPAEDAAELHAEQADLQLRKDRPGDVHYTPPSDDEGPMKEAGDADVVVIDSPAKRNLGFAVGKCRCAGDNADTEDEEELQASAGGAQQAGKRKRDDAFDDSNSDGDDLRRRRSQ